MSLISRIFCLALLIPLLYAAAVTLGYQPPFEAPLPYWASSQAHFSIGATAWLTVMGAILMAGSHRLLSNTLGFLLILVGMGAQFTQDNQLVLMISIAIGALGAFALRSPAVWAKLNLPASIIAIACLLIGRYA